MRKIVDLLLLFFLFIIILWQKDRIVSSYNYLISSPCDQPITYRLGEVDSGYGLSKDQFLSRIESGSQIWNKVVNKNLFAYKTDGKMAFNLIYSDRQSMIDRLNSLENNLHAGKQSLNSSLSEYKALQADFQKKLQDFNAEVEKWNKLGGAPQEVYTSLKNQQQELQTEADKLNQMAASLNLSAQNYNLEVGQYNQSAKNFEQALKESPEAGIYDSSVPKIDIYMTTSKDELIHTIAHEMGHVLELSHLDDPQAIMYRYSSEVVKPDSQEAADLMAYCNRKNIELAILRLKELITKQPGN